MDDIMLRYYEAEMRYLREAGKEFALAHPDRARMLNLDRVGDRDPYVERMHEGFAFLTARLQQKLDDELPELTEGLVTLLWPHYLRMIPSLSVVEFGAGTKGFLRGEVIPEGVRVETSPVAGAHVRCRYRTTQTVATQPICLSEAGSLVGLDGRPSVRLRFDVHPAATGRAKLDLSAIRLFLHADLPTAFAMHLALTRQVVASRWRFSDDSGGVWRDSPRLQVRAAGFGAEERLWPQGDASFSGYELLLEYFSFREKFLFLTIEGLQASDIPERAEWFELDFLLSEPFPPEHAFSAENVRLHCAPVINLFPLEADPIVVDHHETDYRVIPAKHFGPHVETYAVHSVTGFEHATAQRYDYEAFSSFRHRGGMLRHDAPERYFHTRVRQGPNGLHDTWIVLGGHAWETMEELPRETLSLSVVGTNGMLPRKGLRDARINRIVGSAPGAETVTNLCPPSLPLYPPVEDRFQWRVLSHLAPNFLSLMDAEVLRGALALYDWTDDELNRRRLEGIRHVAQHLRETLRRGALERGVLIEVTLDSQAFSGQGDVCLFGELLHQFFAAYAEVNLFTQLTLISLPSGKRIEWPRREASRMPL